MKLGCVVMAAGSSLRYGGNKLTAILQGKPLYCRALEAVPVGVFHRVCVVTQYGDVAETAAAMGFETRENPHPERGVSHTISLGLQAMADCQGVLFMTADQPLLRAQTVRRLAEQFNSAPDRIVAAASQGKRGNPCMFPSEFFPALLALEGDTGGGKIIRAHPERVLLVEVPARELLDADTPEALERIRRGCVTNK